MKLLLTSAGISNASIQKSLVELLGKPIFETSALFVPTAIYGIRGGANIIDKVIRGTLGDPFCQLGWKSLGILEFNGPAKHQTRRLVADASVHPHLSFYSVNRWTALQFFPHNTSPSGLSERKALLLPQQVRIPF